MRPEFTAGVRSVFERGREMAIRNAPMIIGAVSGAISGRIVSPEDDPNQLVVPGALLGMAVGAIKGKRHVMTP